MHSLFGSLIDARVALTDRALRLVCVLVCLSGVSFGQLAFDAGAGPESALERRVTEGYTLMEQGEYERALQAFGEALNENSDNLSARLGQALVYADKQEHAEAFGAFDQIVQIYPDNAFAWNGRGLAAFNMENFEEALSSFSRATADQPVNGFFYESLAWTHMCRGDYPEALKSAKTATLMYNQKGQSSAYPLLIAYFSSMESGDVGAARRTLNYALKNKPPLNQWPYPVFDYLAESIDASELISHIRDTAQETEAHTYIGLKRRASGDPAGAEPHLRWVAEKGDDRVFEYTLAKALHAHQKVASIMH